MTSQTIGFEIILPNQENIKQVMTWRNDPVTRKLSFHDELKTEASFKKEFLTRYFEIPSLPPLFILKEGQRIGVIFFNVYHAFKEQAVISINLAPEMRGKGLSRLILKPSIEWVQQRGFKRLIALVKDENSIAKKTFEKAEFTALGREQIFVSGNRQDYTVYARDLISQERVFVIAEAGVNWRLGAKDKDLAMAKQLIRAAAEADCDAVKFQLYHPKGVYVPNSGKADYLSQEGLKEDINTIFEDFSLPVDWLPLLAHEAKIMGIEFMCSFFSKQDFFHVDPYVSKHKIASYESNHIRLLELAARSNKPLILSTGASTEEDIAWAVDTYQQLGGRELTLMHCIAQYPADNKHLHLRILQHLKKRFNCTIGLSDHSLHPLYAPIAAVSLGATVIEKHFTLDRRLPGPDHFFALTVKELEEMVKGIREVETMLGNTDKVIQPVEQELYHFAKRGIQAISSIKQGDIFEEGVNIDILRPGQQTLGLHSRFLSMIEGKKAKMNIALGQGIQKGDFDEND